MTFLSFFIIINRRDNLDQWALRSKLIVNSWLEESFGKLHPQGMTFLYIVSVRKKQR